MDEGDARLHAHAARTSSIRGMDHKNSRALIAFLVEEEGSAPMQKGDFRSAPACQIRIQEEEDVQNRSERRQKRGNSR